MTKQLIIRRGSKSTMSTPTKGTIILAEGEFFLEYQTDKAGLGDCKIKIGDGVTPYAALPYAFTDSVVEFTEDQRTDFDTVFSGVVSGNKLSLLIARIKRCIKLIKDEMNTNYYSKDEVNAMINEINLKIENISK